MTQTFAGHERVCDHGRTLTTPCEQCRIAMGDFLPADGRVVSVMETNVEVLISEVRNAFDVTRLLGAGFAFATREDYDLAKEWAERAYQAGREYQETVHDSSHKAGSGK